jgi:RNA 2',3'-cyclic 3'-phosphodiesterase
MSECTRTFIAIVVPEPVGRNLARLQTELAPEVSGCRWTSGSPFHMTLAFLGDVPNDELNPVCQIVASSAGSTEPFEIRVGGLGAFPTTSKPRVIWAGATAPNLKPLVDLQESIARSLARIGYRPDDQRFHPHVTLGRIKHDRQRVGDLAGLIERHRLWSAGQYRVEDVVIFASTLGPGGPRYEVLGRGPLAGKKTEGHP